MPKKTSLIIYMVIAAISWVVSLSFIFWFVNMLTRPCSHEKFNYMQTGQIGDTIGGISAPFIGVAGAILTFLAFYMQYKANEMHTAQFHADKVDKHCEKFEEKIFFLIQQNRSIVENMTIADKVHGATCFYRMYLEYRVIFEITKEFYDDKLDIDLLANISYIILFNGVGETSDDINLAVLKDVPRISLLINKFRGIYLNDKFGWIGTERLNKQHEIEEFLSRLEYIPFDGHITRLGHYFRNLYHTLKYTDAIDTSLINKEDKYEIIKSLRSQLTNYEQIIIYLNAISYYGTPMKNAGHIITYQLIKNIVLPQIKFAGDIETRFPEVEFEWNEIVARTNAV